MRRVNGESTVEQAGLQHGAVLLFRGAQTSVLAPSPPSTSNCPDPSDPAVKTNSNILNTAATCSSTTSASPVSQEYRPSTGGTGRGRGGVAAPAKRVFRSPAGFSSMPAITSAPPSMLPILPAPTPTSVAVPSWSAPASAAAVVAAAAAAAVAAANNAAGRLVAPLAQPTPPVFSTKPSEIRSAIDPTTTRSLMLLPAVSSSYGGKTGVAVGAPGWEDCSSRMADAGAGDMDMATARGITALSAQHQQRREVCSRGEPPQASIGGEGYIPCFVRFAWFSYFIFPPLFGTFEQLNRFCIFVLFINLPVFGENNTALTITLCCSHPLSPKALDNITQSTLKPQDAFDNNGYHEHITHDALVTSTTL